MVFLANSSKKQSGQIITYAGKYNVEITAAEYSRSKNSGFDVVTLTYRVLDGTEMGNIIPFDILTDDRPDEMNGKNKSYYAYQKINSFLIDGLGAKDNDPFDMEQAGKVLVGKKLAVNVKWRKNEYNGKTTWRANVTSYHPLMTASEPDTSQPRPQATEGNNNNGGGTSAFGNSAGSGFGNAASAQNDDFGPEPPVNTDFGAQPAQTSPFGQAPQGGFGGQFGGQ